MDYLNKYPKLKSYIVAMLYVSVGLYYIATPPYWVGAAYIMMGLFHLPTTKSKVSSLTVDS